MNYIRHLTGFFQKVSLDERLHPSHISLYIALFQFWNVNRFSNPISITRSEVMRISKIYAKATYHKGMKDLHAFGYINYKPSYNPYKGSLVYLFPFVQDGNEKLSSGNSQAVSEPGKDPPGAGHRLINEQVLVPSINRSKQTNTIPNKKDSGSLSETNLVVESTGGKSASIDSAASSTLGDNKNKPPAAIGVVVEYFLALGSAQTEADRFFNYYSSKGWLVGGVATMIDWQAAARNWVSNKERFASSRTQQAYLHKHKRQENNAAKNYSEPL